MSQTDLQHYTRLPSAVRDLALRLGVKPAGRRSEVTLTQAGRMKAKIDARSWMAFTATQSLSMRTCAFDWRARAGPLGLVSGRDALEHGEGRFDIIALGFIPIARAAHTAALVRGELMRYLAELPWAPDAIFLNPSLRWRADDADGFVVGAGEGETAVEVMLSLDAAAEVGWVLDGKERVYWQAHIESWKALDEERGSKAQPSA